MVETAIVTVVDEEKQYRGDLEVPVNVPAKELSALLTDFLWKMRQIQYYAPERVFLQYKGKRIADDLTLADVGAWDGSVIEIGEDAWQPSE